MSGRPADDILWRSDDGGLTLRARAAPGPAFVAQLEATWFGTAGLRYRRLGLAETLARLPDPAFLELEDEQGLLGTYAVARSRLLSPSGPLEGRYRGLLSIRSDRQGEGLGRLLVGQTLAWLAREAAAAGRPLLSWGCVELRNDRSLGLLQAGGAVPLGELETMLVYRQWPRPRATLDVLDESRGPEVARALGEAQRDCAYRVETAGGAPFLALCDDAGILAGARAVPTRVELGRIGGPWDLLYERLFRYVPAARRRFDPRNFTYLRLWDVVVRPGQAHLWGDFLTSVLARHRVHMAMFVVEPRARAYRLLQEAGLFGRFARSTRQRLRVLGRSWGLADHDPAPGAPLGLGPLDV